MHEPPVQPDRCALSGNYRLESNPVRHDLTPLATATGKQDVREMYREFLKWWPDCGYTERTDLVTCLAQDCYHGSEVPQLTEPSKNHLPRWFFRFPRKRLRFERMNLKKIMAFDEQMSQLLRLIEKMPLIQVIYFPKLILYFNIRKRPFPTPRFSLFFNISNTWDHPI